MSSLPELRRFYARYVTAGLSDPRVTEAFATVPREAFVGPGPWKIPVADGYLDTETDDPAILYQDILIALSAENRLHNGEPSLHAKCLDVAAVKPGEHVIHVGAGTGYYTAILAQLAGAAGRVEAWEIEPTLAGRAVENLRGYQNVMVHTSSAVDAHIPVADVFYVSAGVTDLPSPWLDHARPGGGRLVLPLTPAGGLGAMWVITRVESRRYAARAFSPAVFVPCIGASDADGTTALAEAYQRAAPDRVRSLRRDGSPDDTAWYAGAGWWLSTSEP